MADQRVNPETNAPERECEECLKWLGLYEFPTRGRTWICKVCQGMKAPPKQKVASGVNYQEYLEALEAIDEKRTAIKDQYRDADQQLLKERKAVVKAYYARLGKGLPMGRPAKGSNDDVTP